MLASRCEHGRTYALTAFDGVMKGSAAEGVERLAGRPGRACDRYATGANANYYGRNSRTV